MAFLRKKRQSSPTKALSEKLVIGSPQAQVPTATNTPLYSRFASSNASQTRLVSAPMTLQQRQPQFDRPRGDDPRRRNTPTSSNSNLRVASGQDNSRTRALRTDKPLPPPGESSPNLMLPTSQSNLPSQPSHSSSPKPQMPPAENGIASQPPTSFSRTIVSPHHESNARASRVSLLSDLPDHMYNIHHLDLGGTQDTDTSTSIPPRHGASSSPQQQSEMPQSRSALGAPQPTSINSQQSHQSQQLEKSQSRSIHTPDTTTRPVPAPDQTRVPRRASMTPVSQNTQPPQPVGSSQHRPRPIPRHTSQSNTVNRPNGYASPTPPLARAPSQGTVVSPVLHRSVSRTAPHAALMRSPSSSQASDIRQSNTPGPSTQPTSQSTKRMTISTGETPYDLANPVSSVNPDPKPATISSGPQRRLIDLDDPTPIAPTNVVGATATTGGRRPSTSPVMRKGPLIFAARPGGSLFNDEATDNTPAGMRSRQPSPLQAPDSPGSSSRKPPGVPQSQRLPQPHWLSKATHQSQLSRQMSSNNSHTTAQLVPESDPYSSPLRGAGSKSTVVSNFSSNGGSSSDVIPRLGTADSLASTSSLASLGSSGSPSPTRRRRKDSNSAKKEQRAPFVDGVLDDHREGKKPHRLVKQKSSHLRPWNDDRLSSSPPSLSPTGFGTGEFGMSDSPQDLVSKVDDETIRRAGLPLDDDPFASGGIRVLQPPSDEMLTSHPKESGAAAFGFQVASVLPGATPPRTDLPSPPPTTPSTPPDRQHRPRAELTPPQPPPYIADLDLAQDRDPAPFPLPLFLTFSPGALSNLLDYLSFYDFCCLSVVTRQIRQAFEEEDTLREVVLERFLGVVGYERWAWGKEAKSEGDLNGASGKRIKAKKEDDKEPLKLTLKDLRDYMRGVSMPVHEYARTAGQHIHQIRNLPREERDAEIGYQITALAASTRAYTRVVVRLRAQAERKQKDIEKNRTGGHQQQNGRPESAVPSQSVYTAPPTSYSISNPTPKAPSRPASRASSRAPSPSHSMFSHSHHGHMNGYQHPPSRSYPIVSSQSSTSLHSKRSTIFNSPLFRLRRAPLLRVFVPSPDGTWLSDASVLECEAELRRAGVVALLRPGDVVWDVAVGDEANMGRLIWDGSYLIDLDYTYSNIGDIPKYIPGLAFSPSYFHKTVRTASSSANPVTHLDISPWGEEIASRLQLIQDRVRTETPQGAHHNVVRWVHRSTFIIKPPALQKQSSMYYSGEAKPSSAEKPKIAIPGHPGMFVDPGWYGTIVVEAEGTNEGLADLQGRCGPGAFPPRARGVNHTVLGLAEKEKEQRMVFRILRERSRPGELWIRTVTAKERIM